MAISYFIKNGGKMFLEYWIKTRERLQREWSTATCLCPKYNERGYHAIPFKTENMSLFFGFDSFFAYFILYYSENEAITERLFWFCARIYVEFSLGVSCEDYVALVRRVWSLFVPYLCIGSSWWGSCSRWRGTSPADQGWASGGTINTPPKCWTMTSRLSITWRWAWPSPLLCIYIYIVNHLGRRDRGVVGCPRLSVLSFHTLIKHAGRECFASTVLFLCIFWESCVL